MHKQDRFEFTSISDPVRGILRVFNTDEIPFEIKRIFTISGKAEEVRGKHAHKRCNQLLTCVSGSIELTYQEKSLPHSIILDEKNAGIWIRNGIWAEQKYLTDDSVLLVICDLPYDEDDYIRNYDDFLKWRNKKI